MNLFFKEKLDMLLLDYVDGKNSIWNFIIKFSINYIPYIRNKVQSYKSINRLLFTYYTNYRGQ